MKVFISWSGEPSKQIALALRPWLKAVIQAVKPYMSDQDNEAGVRWEEVIVRELDESNFGIICLTPANVNKPWLHFEAGALGKAVDRGRVVPLLYNLSNADVGPPLSIFQMKALDKRGLSDTVTAINHQMDEPLEKNELAESFRRAWPELEEALGTIAERHTSEEPAPQRTDRELIEEILELLRNDLRRNARQVSAWSDVVTATTPPAESLPNSSRIMLRLREIVGPEGLVEMSGQEVILKGLRVRSLTDSVFAELLEISSLLKSRNIELRIEAL